MRVAIPISLVLLLLLPFGRCASAAGAFAFGQGQNGAWSGGTAWNYLSSEQASDATLHNCQARGMACQLITLVQDQCFAAAVQNGSNGWAWATASNASVAQTRAITSCEKMGIGCSVSADSAFCDGRSGLPKAVVCVKPVFAEEFKLRAMIDGSSSMTTQVADAINFLRSQFCRTTADLPVADSSASLQAAPNCYQYSGLYRGERVYWGECQGE